MTGAIFVTFWSMVSAVIVPADDPRSQFPDDMRPFVACVQMHVWTPVTDASMTDPSQPEAIQRRHERATRACGSLDTGLVPADAPRVANATGSPVDVIVG